MSKSPVNGSTYGQYCPLALAAELLCRRWTVLVISRLLDGCRTFNEIHRGLPKISPSLLSTRLSELEHAGLLKRRRIGNGNRYRYEPTDATLDLNDLVEGMAVWGQRWSRDMCMDDLDPAFLAWSMSLRMDTGAMPPGRTVVEFEFTGTPTEFRRFWLVNKSGEVEMCLKDPGYETDLHVKSDMRRFVEAWRGFRNLRGEIRSGKIRLTGPEELKSSFPDWMLLSTLAPYDRRASGREKRLQSD
ncbi:MAG: helix-turn-helix domain-containing protein [Pseudomonadota bacterium]